MFSGYFRIEQLSDEVKVVHKIKIGAKVPRFDLVAQAGDYKPFEALKNPKGMTIFYLNECKGIINSPDSRRADRYLQGKDSINFSSVYLLDCSAQNHIGYGNPSNAKTFGKKQVSNPFLNYKNDGYLFIISKDFKTIEILIIPNGKFTIMSNAKELADGKYDEAIDQIRASSRPDFLY